MTNSITYFFYFFLGGEQPVCEIDANLMSDHIVKRTGGSDLLPIQPVFMMRERKKAVRPNAYGLGCEESLIGFGYLVGAVAASSISRTTS